MVYLYGLYLGKGTVMISFTHGHQTEESQNFGLMGLKGQWIVLLCLRLLGDPHWNEML